MSSEGTSLEDIENGNIKDVADNSIMSDILRDMNAIDAQQPQYQQPQPQYQQPQPQYQQQPQPMPEPPSMPMYPNITLPSMAMPTFPTIPAVTQRYQEEPTVEPPTAAATARKNVWSSMFEMLRDPIIVAIIVGLLSLPALHTRLSKSLKWAYAVGGSLSWTGLILQSIIGGAAFALFRECLQDLM